MKKGDKKPSSLPRMLAGCAVSAGFCRGKVYILDRFSDKVIMVAKVGARGDEQRKFSQALEKVKIETIYMEKRVRRPFPRRTPPSFIPT